MLLDDIYGFYQNEHSIDEFVRTYLSQLEKHDIDAILLNEALEKGSLPENLTAQARTALYRATSSHLLYKKALSLVFEKLNIPFVLLKGAALWRYYDNPYLRPQEDIDILVEPENMQRACSAVRSAAECRSFEQTEYHTAISFKNSTIPDVEIHTATGPSWKSPFSAETIFKNTEHITLSGHDILVPDFKYQLMHSLTHAANHHILTKLKWLIDVKKILNLSQNRDISFLKKTNGYKSRSFYAVLHYTNLIFPCKNVHKALDQTSVSTISGLMLKWLIPENRLFDNPILTNRLRRHLYNLFMIRNPVNMLNKFLPKMNRTGTENEAGQ